MRRVTPTATDAQPSVVELEVRLDETARHGAALPVLASLLVNRARRTLAAKSKAVRKGGAA